MPNKCGVLIAEETNLVWKREAIAVLLREACNCSPLRGEEGWIYRYLYILFLKHFVTFVASFCFTFHLNQNSELGVGTKCYLSPCTFQVTFEVPHYFYCFLFLFLIFLQKKK